MNQFKDQDIENKYQGLPSRNYKLFFLVV